jgi:membrane protein DedA with SNARE-associated domain
MEKFENFIFYVRFGYIFWAPVATILCAFYFEYVLTKKSRIKAGFKIFILLLIQAVLFMPAGLKTHVVGFPVFWWEVFFVERRGPDGAFFEIELASGAVFYFLLVAIAVVSFQQWRRRRRERKNSPTNPTQ